jgi:hypothetical protein
MAFLGVPQPPAGNKQQGEFQNTGQIFVFSKQMRHLGS